MGCGASSVSAGPAHAVRALGLLSGGVGADRRALDDGARIDGQLAARDGRGEAIHAARGRAALLLAGLVVLRAVARALEPLRRLAGRHAAAEMRALLVQDGDARLEAV